MVPHRSFFMRYPIICLKRSLEKLPRSSTCTMSILPMLVRGGGRGRASERARHARLLEERDRLVQIDLTDHTVRGKDAYRCARAYVSVLLITARP